MLHSEDRNVELCWVILPNQPQYCKWKSLSNLFSEWSTAGNLPSSKPFSSGGKMSEKWHHSSERSHHFCTIATSPHCIYSRSTNTSIIIMKHYLYYKPILLSSPLRAVDEIICVNIRLEKNIRNGFWGLVFRNYLIITFFQLLQSNTI